MSDLISRQAVIDTIETDCSWDIFNEWGSRTPTGECIINAIKSVPSVETESCGDCISRQAVLDLAESGKLVSNGSYKSVCDAINGLPPVEPERKVGKCKGCKYFEYDSMAKVDGIPLIVAHEICKRWGDGCKTSEDGYCFLYEPQEREDNTNDT